MATKDSLGDWCKDADVMNNDVMLSTTSTKQDNKSKEFPSQTNQEEADDTFRYDGYDSCGGQSDEDSSSITSSDSELDGNELDVGGRSTKLHAIRNGADVNSIPIQKDGMAVCEKCGTIGVKHAFYSKSKRFCSLACSKSYTTLQREGKPIPKPKPVFKFPVGKVKEQKKEVTADQQMTLTAERQKTRDLSRTFDWKPYLTQSDFVAVSVACFKHVPLSSCWDNILVGMKVEVENRDFGPLRDLFPHSYWVASVVQLAGYKALLRYEGFGTDSSEDFWINLGRDHVQPVGWCASQGKPLIPPKTIQHKHCDWKEFLVKRLTGARTLPSDFHAKLKEDLTSKYRPGIQLEVVDKNRISSMRVAMVDDIVGGRLHLRYMGADENDEGFWCHEHSPLIHPIGWSQVIGHTLQASLDYQKRSLQKAVQKKFEEHEASWDMFPQMKVPQTTLRFREGMKLESIDPLNLSTICVATVTKVLRNNYIMIGIDGYLNENGSDWFCYHSSSPSLFPVGFCELNNIDLTPPRGHKGEFRWFDYLKQTKSVTAPVGLFNRELPSHGIKVGMKLEAVDLMEPRLICVGTVTRVVNRLLRVHFDGWDDSYDQWCDCESPDLYPVGWCELMAYHLEPPRNLSQPEMNRKGPRKAKGQISKGPKRGILMTKRKSSLLTGRLKTNGKTGMHLGSDLNLSMMKSYEEEVVDQGTSVATDITKEGPGPKQAKVVAKAMETPVMSQQSLMPQLWGIQEVVQFMRVNDCGAYADNFANKKVDGRRLLSLTKEQIVNLTGMKVGPSLKIFDLIKKLKAKASIS